jgi:16S rRNA (adenine1518-N6/adenine1519-N6)-dimethyltransferase
VRTNPKALLAAHGLRPKRHFGQNFLVDERCAARIAELAADPTGGTVVEVGAGLGALTTPLLARAARVVAIERDRNLALVLRSEFAGELASGRLAVEEADAKSVALAPLLNSGPPPRVLAGNLPYNITGPLLQRVAQLGSTVDRVVVLVQQEVANRIAAAAGDSSYGALSVFLQAQFIAEPQFTIGSGAFYPAPRVDSTLVVLRPRAVPLAAETSTFRAVVKAAFGQRRKQLRNAWAGRLGLSSEQLARAAERAGIDLHARGETLQVADFARMAREVDQ